LEGMKRVALLLSGHLRSWDKCFPALEALILGPLQPDVFISTWAMMGSSPLIDGSTVSQSTHSIVGRINAAYNPVKLEIEPLRVGGGIKYRGLVVDGRSSDGVSNLFYKKWKVNQLRLNHEKTSSVKYDACIFARPDLKFTDIIPNEAIEEAMNDKLMLPDMGHWDGLNDQVAVANSEAAAKYAACHAMMDGLVRRAVFRPEVLLKQHIKDQKLSVGFFHTDYEIERIVGSPFQPREHSNGIPAEFVSIAPKTHGERMAAYAIEHGLDRDPPPVGRPTGQFLGKVRILEEEQEKENEDEDIHSA